MIAYVPLRQRKRVVAWAQIDACDAEAVGALAWHLDASGYAANPTRERLHRFLIDVPDGYIVDHINRDRLDNRLSNLRVTTQQVNTQNTSGMTRGAASQYRGVYCDRRRGTRWYVQVKHNGVKHNGGSFATEVEAAEAAAALRERVFGEPVCLPVIRRQHAPVPRRDWSKCAHGHPFTPENTYVRPTGSRVCRICSNDAGRRYRLRGSRLAA